MKTNSSMIRMHLHTLSAEHWQMCRQEVGLSLAWQSGHHASQDRPASFLYLTQSWNGICGDWFPWKYLFRAWTVSQKPGSNSSFLSSWLTLHRHVHLLGTPQRCRTSRRKWFWRPSSLGRFCWERLQLACTRSFTEQAETSTWPYIAYTELHASRHLYSYLKILEIPGF